MTNIDFDAWADYLGDPPLAMAFLDRVVDGAIILKINGKSYRAHRASIVHGSTNPKALIALTGRLDHWVTQLALQIRLAGQRLADSHPGRLFWPTS